MRKRIFAANWKMHHDPMAATTFALKFQEISSPDPARDLWFFPPAVSLAATAEAFERRADISVGAQNVHWEAKGAFTGETSAVMISGCGGKGALVGHSERRHVFGETDDETAKKVKALIAQRLVPMLCVGEKLDQREGGHTADVVRRLLKAVLSEITATEAAELLIAYEPVWAIGTGKVARPQDAAEVHREIRQVLHEHRVTGRIPVLYGGSVNMANVAGLLAEDEIDGVLVGGASLEAEGWAAIVAAGA
ncbi:MAG TPA: triose-phosphate isomerase [Gemmatimonadales bacterium]|nr:triose-phosphate isomerase [Gemmatimonadales bacterium]